MNPSELEQTDMSAQQISELRNSLGDDPSFREKEKLQWDREDQDKINESIDAKIHYELSVAQYEVEMVRYQIKQEMRLNFENDYPGIDFTHVEYLPEILEDD